MVFDSAEHWTFRPIRASWVEAFEHVNECDSLLIQGFK